ncbi:MAG TPA: hypothetical protein VMH81_11580 [Bryobacteraceae bacterium]|nr:hypothetical protein [Bryobacteraceae bacterium]
MDGGGDWPAQPLAVLPSVGRAGASSFLQNLSLEGGKNREHGRHCSTGWGREVQRFGERYEPDTEVLQFLERRQQIATDRPQRSSRHTSTTSISRRRAASISFSRASRRAAPEFTSRTCMAMVPPRRAAYSRIARFCIARVC